MARVFVGALLSLLLVAPAWADRFPQGSLIIPMDTTYQDSGMLQAFGLLYQLLKAEIPVHWVIKTPKNVGDVDFTATSKDLQSDGDPLPPHGYRGGPFVVQASSAAAALPIVRAWQALHPNTKVHEALGEFEGNTGRLLTAAPTIAIIADGAQAVAFKYLNAAAIPDAAGHTWSNTSPDLLTIAGIAGTTATHNDGVLFRPSGQPAYCQIMTMHWNVKDVDDEVVAEYREFLHFPTHMMAECQAVNAIENDVNGKFLTPNGFVIDNDVADNGPFEFRHAELPFAQIDGAFKLVSGSEQAYTLPEGDSFRDLDVVMIKDASTPLGVRSIWMTGYVDASCTMGGDVAGLVCSTGVGKISYLGGHSYGTAVPISKNPTSQGTRLFLNSLFEASCASAAGQPVITLELDGPVSVTEGTITYTLHYANSGLGPALELALTNQLPLGSSYSSSTGGGSLSGDVVTWRLGDLAAGAGGTVQLTVTVGSPGLFSNQGATLQYQIGANTRRAQSNSVLTAFQTAAPDAGIGSDASVADSGLYADASSPSFDATVGHDAMPRLDLGVGDSSAQRDAAAADALNPSLDAAMVDASTSARDAQSTDGGAGGDSGRDLLVDAPSNFPRDASAAKQDRSSPGQDQAGSGGEGGGSGCDCAMAGSAAMTEQLGLLLAVVFVLACRRRRR